MSPTSTTKQQGIPRTAVGIVRVSQVKGRDGESFASPEEQRERIETACERDGLKLVEVLSELDRVDRLACTTRTLSVNPLHDWDKLTVGEHRALIKETIARATVAPGRGADRISVETVT